jgi:hypothetical protein
MRGRFRQGLYPLGAPLGHVDNGGGNPNTLDPVRAALIRQTFELYSSGYFSAESMK